MLKTLQSVLLLCVITLALACGKDAPQAALEGSAAAHADVQDIWWTKTGGAGSTLSDMYLAKDGTYKTNANQVGTYKLTEGKIAVKVPGPGGEFAYEIVSASSTELKVKVYGHEYTFTPRKE